MSFKPAFYGTLKQLIALLSDSKELSVLLSDSLGLLSNSLDTQSDCLNLPDMALISSKENEEIDLDDQENTAVIFNGQVCYWNQMTDIEKEVYLNQDLYSYNKQHKNHIPCKCENFKNFACTECGALDLDDDREWSY